MDSSVVWTPGRAPAQPTARAPARRQGITVDRGRSSRVWMGWRHAPHRRDATLGRRGRVRPDLPARGAVPQGDGTCSSDPATTPPCCASSTATWSSRPTCWSRAGTSVATGPSAADVGHRAAAQNLSDINAMGGTRAPRSRSASRRPRDLPVAWALDFARGFAEECACVGASVVGGDVTRADRGGDRGHGARRVHPGARPALGRRSPATSLALAGRQGWAAGGLAVLGRGFRSPAGARRGLPPAGAAVRRRARPPPRPGRPP